MPNADAVTEQQELHLLLVKMQTGAATEKEGLAYNAVAWAKSWNRKRH